MCTYNQCFRAKKGEKMYFLIWKLTFLQPWNIAIYWWASLRNEYIKFQDYLSWFKITERNKTKVQIVKIAKCHNSGNIWFWTLFIQTLIHKSAHHPLLAYQVSSFLLKYFMRYLANKTLIRFFQRGLTLRWKITRTKKHYGTRNPYKVSKC